MDVVIQDSTSQQKLCANVAAQIMAFACGKSDPNPNKSFSGARPSSIIVGDQLTPEALGALLAHFENKVMFQGFVWNLNSFDQEGVQLGKVLAKRVLAHDTDGALRAYSDLLNI
jgi:glucose-6-phosphate isomerase